MLTQNFRLIAKILDIRLRGNFTCTAELRGPAAMESYVLFVTKFFAIHCNMGQAQWGNISLHKLTSQS